MIAGDVICQNIYFLLFCEQDIDNDNMMSHLNALELSAASQPTISDVSGASAAPNESVAAAQNDSEKSDIPAAENQTEEDDGWTTVTKGGRRKKGR